MLEEKAFHQTPGKHGDYLFDYIRFVFESGTRQVYQSGDFRVRIPGGKFLSSRWPNGKAPDYGLSFLPFVQDPLYFLV
jgi:hypothetical protein